MQRHLLRNLILLAVVVLTTAVGCASFLQRSSSQTAYDHNVTAQSMLTAMLDQETGLRGLALTGREEFLAPYVSGRRAYVAAERRARRQVAGDPKAAAALQAQRDAAQQWSMTAAWAIHQLRSGRRRQALAIGQALRRKALMDQFRVANRRYTAIVRDRSTALETRAVVGSAVLVALLGTFFALVGGLVARRLTRLRRAERERERDYEAGQRDLALGLQVTESEEEAHDFLRRHLERSIPGSEVVVLNRNNSANRLRAGTPLAKDSRLREPLVDAEPRSCLSIRLAQRRDMTHDAQRSVLQCGLCGALEGEATCSPLLVGGEVIGSVLVGHPEPLEEQGSRAIDESVKQAAPVLANLRNLAIAESRAATDGLTGLPNRRAFEESLKRMVAHANRAMSPLAAVALDLDHFKAINDVYGHARGDEVLAEVGALLKSLLRDSDFVARVGGEEFMVLLPDTGRDGALVICERIRAAIAALEFSMDRDVTSSLGVATLPEDATDGQNLVRAADRMLYAAKDAGRNRVEITELSLGPVPDEALA